MKHIVFGLLILASCQTEQPKFQIDAAFGGGAGKYIKYIDMTQPGLKPDSLLLDDNGKFQMSQITQHPKDYIFFFSDKEYIRLVVCPNEQLVVKGLADSLVETYSLSGSVESEQVSLIIKRHFRAVHILDTLQRFYMKNQNHPQLDDLIGLISTVSDSVYADEKAFLQSFIENNPGSIAAYIALSQKLGYNRNLFTLSNDLSYFERVDTALSAKYDTIPMSNMLHAYVKRGKLQLAQQAKDTIQNMIGAMAPDIQLPNPWGDTLKLSTLKGKYVLIDFWGTWCRPCRLHNADLRNTYRMFRPRGFDIFQVAIERNITDWRNTLREDKLYWRYQVSELNYMESKVARMYGVTSIPSNFLIDPDGRIIARDLYGEALNLLLNEVLKPIAVVPQVNP